MEKAGNDSYEAVLLLQPVRCASGRAEIKQRVEIGGPCHARLGCNVSDHCVDRGYFGLRRGCRRLDRNGQDHLLHRGRTVFGLSRGRSGPPPYPSLALSLIGDWPQRTSTEREA